MAAGTTVATAHSSGSIIKSSCRLIWVATLAAGAKSNIRGPHVGAHVLLGGQSGWFYLASSLQSISNIYDTLTLVIPNENYSKAY